MDINPTILAVCGVSCGCLGAFLLAMMAVSRMFGKSLLIPMVTAVGALWGMVFKRGGNEDQDVEKFLSQRRRKRTQFQPGQSDAGFSAQSVDLDFDSQVQQRLNQQGVENFNLQPPGQPTPSSPQDRTFDEPGPARSRSNLGRRFSDRPDDLQQTSTPPPFGADSPLGPPPSDISSLRARRRRGSSRRGRDSNAQDDEIFGGMLDEDGDNFPDS